MLPADEINRRFSYLDFAQYLASTNLPHTVTQPSKFQRPPYTEAQIDFVELSPAQLEQLRELVNRMGYELDHRKRGLGEYLDRLHTSEQDVDRHSEENRKLRAENEKLSKLLNIEEEN